jgi:hypothetical protein
MGADDVGDQHSAAAYGGYTIREPAPNTIYYREDGKSQAGPGARPTIADLHNRFAVCWMQCDLWLTRFDSKSLNVRRRRLSITLHRNLLSVEDEPLPFKKEKLYVWLKQTIPPPCARQPKRYCMRNSPHT